MKYYVQNNDAGYIGNSPTWWAVDNAGYTGKLCNAKRWTKDEIVERKFIGNPKFSVWECDHIDLNAYKMADMQLMIAEYKLNEGNL